MSSDVDMKVMLVGHDWLGLVLVEVDKRTRIAVATTVGHCFSAPAGDLVLI